ncbi:hypothetical protein KAH94_03595 [bacterium]|nr:hypothetical protein [bacterium]
MKSIFFDYTPESSRVTVSDIEKITTKLLPELHQIKNAVGSGYKNEYASLNLSSNSQMIDHVKNLVAKKKKDLNICVLVVIGIGGSSLGAVAVHESINGVLYNELSSEMKIYFVDTIDTDYVRTVLLLVEREFKNGGGVLLNVVTKSGTTTETIVNFEIFLELLKKYKQKSYADHIVITSDRDSKLWNYAQNEKIETLEIPKNVGGRFSVFSPVGLFPLGLVGVDIDQLCSGALSVVDSCTEKDLKKNYAAESAAFVYAQYKKGFSIHDTFIFSRDMRAVGDWYRQLVGESLGKKVDRSGNVVNVGITPTVSVGTNDLHSVVQLYLGGPRDKLTTFITLKDDQDELRVPQFDEFDSLVANIQGKTVASIRAAVVRGVQRAYHADERPFVTIEIPEKSAFCLGQLLQMKMIEVMYLGYLLGVNPFDQPQVELYKKETREILAAQ